MTRDPAKRAAQSERYYQKHRDSILSKRSAYHETNRDRELARMHAYRASHCEALRASRARRYAERRAANAAKARRYHAKHRRQVLERMRAYRARRRDALKVRRLALAEARRTGRAVAELLREWGADFAIERAALVRMVPGRKIDPRRAYVRQRRRTPETSAALAMLCAGWL